MGDILLLQPGCQRCLIRQPGKVLAFLGVQESMHYFKYKHAENVLYEFADDIAPRHITAALPLDYDTVAAADKFCNVFLTRLPADVSAQARRLTRQTLCLRCVPAIPGRHCPRRQAYAPLCAVARGAVS